MIYFGIYTITNNLLVKHTSPWFYGEGQLLFHFLSIKKPTSIISSPIGVLYLARNYSYDSNNFNFFLPAIHCYLIFLPN